MAKRKAIKKKSTTVHKTVQKNKSNSKKASKGLSHWHAVPLKGSFMATAMLGFLISAFWVYPQSLNYGITFMIIFILMFIASFVSLTKAPVLRREY
jgi:F0F1-type ATP synthase assembly protein I